MVPVNAASPMWHPTTNGRDASSTRPVNHSLYLSSPMVRINHACCRFLAATRLLVVAKETANMGQHATTGTTNRLRITPPFQPNHLAKGFPSSCNRGVAIQVESRSAPLANPPTTNPIHHARSLGPTHSSSGGNTQAIAYFFP